MTIPHPHAALIHAFADGKTLQFYMPSDTWVNYQGSKCPDFDYNNIKWRIKPDEPKKVKLECWVHRGTGALLHRYVGDDLSEYHFRAPNLDYEVTMEEA